MQPTDTILATSYDWRLIVLSYIIAVLASYTALDLAGRVTAARGRARRSWLLGGAFAMGAGIWSMHFTGMLAFSLPIAITYDVPIVLLSLVVAMIASGFALFVASRDVLSLERLLISGLPMGIGIATMHYSGMAALRMPAMIDYDPPIFGLSILIAVVASSAALWLAFQLRSERIAPRAWLALKIGSALVMGVAITGMHYTGMLAAHFMPIPGAATEIGIDALPLGAAIGIATVVILGLALISSLVDQRFTEIKRLQIAEADRRQLLEQVVGEYLGFTQQVAQGDLSQRIEVQYEGALGHLGQGLNTMVASLHDITGQVQAGTNAIAAAVAQISAVATEQAASSAQQSAAIAETATAIEQVKVIALQSAEQATLVAQNSQTALDVARQSDKTVIETVGSMNQIHQQVGNIAQTINSLSDQSRSIGTIIASVSELADQINHLALNAAIESTRAGDQDKDVATLARLVRDLGSQAKQSTAQVRQILSEIQRSSKAAADVTSEGIRQVDIGVQLVTATGMMIHQIAEEVESGSQANVQMAAAARQQTLGMEQISQAMTAIQQAMTQALVGTRQAEQAAQGLHSLAQSLQQAIAVYRL